MSAFRTAMAFVITLSIPAVVLGQFGQPKTIMQATDITKEFADDAAAAKKKYATKTVIVEGVIESFPPDKDGKKDVVLKGHEAGTGVFCNGVPAVFVDKLKVGDKVKISGLGVDKIGPWFVMGACVMYKEPGSVFPMKPVEKKPLPEPGTGLPMKPVEKKTGPLIKPIEKKKDLSVRGKPATGLVTAKFSDWKVVTLVPNLAYISDRDYAIKKYPAEMDGGHVVIRDSQQVKNWVQDAQLSLEKDATFYAAMLVKVDGVEKVTEKQLDAMAADGWEFLKEPFETTTPDKSWVWKVAKKNFEKGPFNPALPKEFLFYVTHAIYVVK